MRRDVPLAITSGALFAAAQPGVGAWPLAFVALVPLLEALDGATARRRLALGWVFGTVATTLATVAAGSVGAVRYFGLSWPAAVGVAALVGQVFGAASFAGFAWLAGSGRTGGVPGRVATVAGALGAAELARATWLTGFPWLLLGYALAPTPGLAGAAAWVGATGVSMLLAGIQVGLWAAWRRGVARGLLACAVPAALLLAPALRPAPAPDVRAVDGASAAPGALRVALLQADPGHTERRDLLARTRRAGALDLAVWPENAIRALLPENRHLLPADLPMPLIVGAPWADDDVPGTFSTVALGVAPGGAIAGRHEKVRLLPFAEYAPGPLPMGWFGAVELAPGRAPGLLVVGDDVRVGPLICYEVLFADVARAQVRGGAGLLLNLSNDAWFGHTEALDQHLAAAVFRAIETGRPMLRSTWWGITAAIDSRGHVIARLPVGDEAVLVVDVTPARASTVYAGTGELAAWLGAAVALGGLLLERARREQGAAVEVRREGQAQVGP